MIAKLYSIKSPSSSSAIFPIIEVEHPNLDKPTIVFAAEPPGVSVSPLMKLSSSFEAMFSTEYSLSTFNAPNPMTSAFKSLSNISILKPYFKISNKLMFLSPSLPSKLPADIFITPSNSKAASIPALTALFIDSSSMAFITTSGM